MTGKITHMPAICYKLIIWSVENKRRFRTKNKKTPGKTYRYIELRSWLFFIIFSSTYVRIRAPYHQAGINFATIKNYQKHFLTFSNKMRLCVPLQDPFSCIYLHCKEHVLCIHDSFVFRLFNMKSIVSKHVLNANMDTRGEKIILAICS